MEQLKIFTKQIEKEMTYLCMQMKHAPVASLDFKN